MNYTHFITDEKIASNTKRTYNSIHNLYFSSFELDGVIHYESIPEIIKMLSTEKIADKTKSSIFSLLTRLMKHSGLDAETIKKFKTQFFNSLSDSSEEENEQVYVTRYTNACIRKDKMISFMVTYLLYWFDIREKDLREIKIYDEKPTKSKCGFFLRAKSILFQADSDGKKCNRKFVIASERMLEKMRTMVGLCVMSPTMTLTDYTYKHKTAEELTQIYLDCADDVKRELRLSTADKSVEPPTELSEKLL